MAVLTLRVAGVMPIVALACMRGGRGAPFLFPGRGIAPSHDGPIVLLAFAFDREILQYLLAGTLALALAVTAWRMSRYVIAALLGRRQASPPPPTADIDVEQLAPTGPPATGPKLTVYNVPARLVVLVLAPVGRGRALPAAERLAPIIDQIVPGLYAAACAHGTRIKLWPPQLSTHGFAAALFANIPLPGNRGRGTPWCTLAGRFFADGQPWLAGLILRADGPNNLSQMTLEREAQWLEVVRMMNDE